MKNIPEDTNQRSGPDTRGAMYDASKYAMKSSLLKFLLITFVLLALLAAVRMLNLTLLWNTTKLELINNPLTQVDNFKFLGLSGYGHAQEKLTNSLTLHKKLTIVSYFDLLHQSVFLIHCNETNSFVNLGVASIYLQPGTTTVSFYPMEIIETKRDGEASRAIYFGDSLFPSLYDKAANYISGTGGGENPSDSGKQMKRRISFILNEMEGSSYLKISYYVYFYLPLLVILTLAGRYGRTFYISFIYYLELFLLFDFKRILFTIPFSWLINLLGVKISQTAAAIAAAVVLIPFVIGIFAGILHNRKEYPTQQVLTPWSKSFIIFFILLPLFLRF